MEEQFKSAMEAISSEFGWTVCEPHDDRPSKGGVVAGVTITKAISLTIRELEDPATDSGKIEQAFRTLFNEIHRDITGETFASHKKLADGSLVRVLTAPAHGKRVVSCLTPLDVWTEATHLFSLRDAKTKVGFDVYKEEQRYQLTSAWGVA